MTKVTALFVLLLVATVDAYAQADAPAVQPAAPRFAQNSVNVFRRFTGDGAKTLAFYGEVLGFGDIGAVAGVSRYQVGTSQLKFTRAGANARFTRGALDAATGMRLWTMWFPDEAALAKRFTDRGYPAPSFVTTAGIRSALVTDPEGEWVQLVIAPDASKETYGQLEVGIAAADLETSRAFYRTFVGLEELPAVEDPVLGLTKYPFRLGTSTISLWAAAAGRPANPALAGIQYVVSNVEAIAALAADRHVPVEQELGETLPGLHTVWLFDPDQVTNYFAEIRPRGRGTPLPATR